MKDNLNPLIVALRSVFAPIVKQSNKWPPILAYGLPGIVAVLLIVLLRRSLPDNLFWLVVVIVLAPLFGYIITDWNTRHQVTVIQGNVLFEDGNPVQHAIVSVDGVDRGRKETDENGWFQITVDEKEAWTVRARYEEEVSVVIVSKKEVKQPVRVQLKKQPMPEKASELQPNSARSSTRDIRSRPTESDQQAPIRNDLGHPQRVEKGNEGNLPPETRPNQAVDEGMVDRANLRDILVRSFNETDLRSLCVDIEEDLRRDHIEYLVDLELVGGDGREGKIVALIEYLENRNILYYLVNAIRRRRPDLL